MKATRQLSEIKFGTIFIILNALKKHDTLNINQVWKVTSHAYTNLLVVVNTMEKCGILEVRRTPRSRFLKMTHAGNNLYNAMASHINKEK